MSTATQLIHSIPVDELTGAISVPIYQTSTFVQEAPGINKGFDYARTGNPTRLALENLVAQLEGGSVGAAFGSGLAAIDAVVKLLQAGDEIVAVDDIYGGAFRLFTQVYQKFGITVRYVDTSNVENVFNAITPKTKLIWLETPTNPTLKISDIQAIAKIAKASGSAGTPSECWLCVDNTFASPALQQPLLLGADIVIHSATKYLGGHSDLIAGVVVTKDAELGAQVKFLQNACGAILSPFDSWLVIRGIETLHLRIKQHCINAQAIAEFLQDHPAVDKSILSGIEKPYQPPGRGQPGQRLRWHCTVAAPQFVTSTRLFKLAESLGGVKSLLCHPAAMTHKSIPEEKRRAAGVSDSLVRLSVGLEDATDLVKDIEQALAAIKTPALQTA
jgi:cystathionine beta-lyase